MRGAGKWFICCLVALGVTGCGSGEERPNVPTQPKQVAESPLSGDATITSIGDLQVRDTMLRAKELFPTPNGAESTAEPELTLEGESHFGWVSEKQVFDAFAANGGVTTISLLKKNLSPAERQTEIDRELERFDEPNENAEGRTTAAYLWRDGDYVRIVVDFFGGKSQGILKVSGSAAALESRGFPLSNLSDLVAAFDETAVQ